MKKKGRWQNKVTKKHPFTESRWNVDRAEVKKAMDRLLDTIERSLETVQSCIEVSKRTLKAAGEEI